jgi:CheY-like chemotaxis protein
VLSAGPLVLIADDFPDACEMYAAYLKHHGFRVLTAFDGREAVATAKQHTPDIILLDIRMPVMDGTEAMRTLKSDPAFANVPIVALTAHAMAHERRSGVDAGFDAYLAKPIAPDQLLQEIMALLDGRKR